MFVSCWNVNSIRARHDHVLQYLGGHKPDILMLQELKTPKDDYPFEAIEALGYTSHMVGQKTYNGVAIITNQDMEVELTALPDNEEDEQARFIQAKHKKTKLRFINIYLPNGNPTLDENGDFHEKFIYKLSWMEKLHKHLQSLMAKDIEFLIAGDWNIAPNDRDAFDPKGWQDDALLRPQSREIYHKILHLGLTDALKTANPDIGYTWWDYRGGGFKRNQGLRIDHILLSPLLADKLISAGIHDDMRALEKPSDHAPIWAKLDLI